MQLPVPLIKARLQNIETTQMQRRLSRRWHFAAISLHTAKERRGAEEWRFLLTVQTARKTAAIAKLGKTYLSLAIFVLLLICARLG